MLQSAEIPPDKASSDFSVPRSLATDQVRGTRAPSNYASLGNLPGLRACHPINLKTRSNASQLLKIYRHSSQQFRDSRDITEKLASFHASHVSKCRSLGINKSETFENLHVLFVSDSSASLFYHQSVSRTAKDFYFRVAVLLNEEIGFLPFGMIQTLNPLGISTGQPTSMPLTSYYKQCSSFSYNSV